jgi:hypothetical protein
MKKDIYENFDFSKLSAINHFSKSKVKREINKKLIVNGKINPAFQKKKFIENRNLIEVFESVLYYTSFLEESAGWKERFFCICNNISSYPKCHFCNKYSKNFNRNFTDGYYGKFCSRSCSASSTANSTKLSKEAKIKRDNKIRKTLLKQRANGLPKEWKDKLKKAANKESVKVKKRKTCLERYGIENPGVLGAYHSKSSYKYIMGFLKDREIPLNQCFFHDDNKKEFFQFVYVPFLKKKRYFSYDLVVFNDEKSAINKNLKEIHCVLEFNGPWHYNHDEIVTDGNSPAVPYKGGTYPYSKKEVWMLDCCKINHMLQFTDVYVYWQKNKKLEFIKQGEKCESKGIKK